MSEVFSFPEWFDYQKMADLASYVAKQLSVTSRVAVGFAEFNDSESENELLLELPTVVIISSDGSEVSSADKELLIDGIKNAAESIKAGQRVNYSVEEYPVLAYGIEDEDNYIGVIFIEVLAHNPDLDMAQHALMDEHIEDELGEMFAIDNEDRTPEEDPYTAWYYGTIFGVPLDTQE